MLKQEKRWKRSPQDLNEVRATLEEVRREALLDQEDNPPESFSLAQIDAALRSFQADTPKRVFDPQ